MLKTFSIVDELAIAFRAGIEVVVELEDGRQKWCYFMTLEALTLCGYSLPETGTLIHYAPHMIIVSQISEKIIEESLRYLDEQGDLEACTLECVAPDLE